MTRRWVWVVVLLAMACASGCRHETPRQQADRAMAQAEALRAGGDTDGAVRLLEKSMADKAFGPFQADFVLKIVQTLLATNRLDAAGDRAYRAASEDPETAGPACTFYAQQLTGRRNTTRR